MKAWKLVISVVFFITVSLPAGRSVENPVTRNPAGYGTIPQSSFRGGLVNTPNPIDPTGNLLMTGNVRRGMHFRGSVPYRSTTSFNATLGSSALNSFLRDTAGSEDFGNLANKYRVQPFYSPTQTVTTMVPGRSEVFNSMNMRMDDRVRQRASFVGDGLLGLDSSSQGHASLSQDATADEVSRVSRGSSLVSRTTRGEIRDTRFETDSVRDDEHVEPLVPGQLGIRDARDGSVERSVLLADDVSREPSSKENLLASSRRRPTKDDLTQYPGDEVSRVSRDSSLVTRTTRGEIRDTRYETDPDSGYEIRSPESDDRQEILEQIRRQLDALMKSVEVGLQKDVEPVPDTQYPILDEHSRDGPLWPFVSGDKTMPGDRKRTGTGTCPYGNDVGILSTTSSLDEFRQREDDVSTNIKKTKENVENLKSFSQARFNKHLSSAEDHLKAGRYYRAVDSFTLASVYQPNNPDVLSGKGHALFAAGEYMSSALFLGRALAIRPDSAQTKVDLAAMLGGADKLAERMADVEQWLARSGSAQLQFLLSYVYFHSGRLNQAKQAIAAAYEKMPDSPAVDAMKTTIEQAAK